MIFYNTHEIHTYFDNFQLVACGSPIMDRLRNGTVAVRMRNGTAVVVLKATTLNCCKF